ncbi:MAG: alpha/beta hydrolase, partial [Planctomycetes bacterium]|nr:alpha/beta hydrolase [Planctomycetota bacterium]
DAAALEAVTGLYDLGSGALVDVAAYHYPWMPVRALMVDRFDSVGHIPAVTCRILQIHGQRDSIVPFSSAKALFAAAPERSASGDAKRFVEIAAADHNDIPLVAAAEYRAALEEFLTRRP